ncbi:MAG: phosphoadenylyl-sulfate reductase [Planctomyces sp.]|nr:phosphoadenylyl-sulfate reductase [Planctomyces sp.]
MARLSQARLVPVNKTFEDRSPLELLHWAKDMFGDRVAAISAMQESGSVLCHMIARSKLNIPVLFVDTGVMYQETLDTRDRIAREYALNIVTLTPRETMQQQTDRLGVLYLSVDGQKQCCHMRKVEPLLQVRDRYDALLGSLRRSDGGKRGECPILAVDPEMNALRINPMAGVDDDQLQAYIREHRVITNPLHGQGFSTIGCNRCTTPVLPTEPKRAGRWRHLGPWSMYCGINPTDVDDATSQAIELPQDLVDRILGQKTDFVI